VIQGDGRCIKIFKQARAGIWKPEEIKFLEKLFVGKATAPRDNPQSIFFQDIAFTNKSLTRVRASLVENNFVPEIFEVCEGRLSDISCQEKEKSRTIIVEKDANHAFGFKAYFADAHGDRYLGRTISEAIGALIEHSKKLLNLEIEWSGNVVTQDYLRKLEDESWDDPDSFRGLDGVPLSP